MNEKQQPPVRGADTSCETHLHYTQDSSKTSVFVDDTFRFTKFAQALYLSSNNNQSDQTVRNDLLPAPTLDISQQRTKEDGTRPAAGSGSLPTKAIKFTAKTRRKLLVGALALDRLGPQSVLFITTTLAGSTQSAVIAFESFSSYFLKRFAQWVRNQFSKSDEVLYLWCYERQDRGALHLHFAVFIPPYLRSKFSQSAVQAQVRSIHLEICRQAGVDLFAFDGGTWALDREKPIVHAIWITSPRAYFSKRKTKSSLILPDGTESSPTRWGNCSVDLGHLVQALSCDRHVPVMDVKFAKGAVREAWHLIKALVLDRVGTKQSFRRLRNEYAPGSFGLHCTIPPQCVDDAVKGLKDLANRLEDRVLAGINLAGERREAALAATYKQARQRVVFSLGLDGYLQLKYYKRPLSNKELSVQYKAAKKEIARQKRSRDTYK
jgi:hypothetical protein